MKPEDRANLKRILAGFDEAGLVALANKGLVRRAQKDLEAGGLAWEETDAAVIVQGPGWNVTMPPSGPQQATDNTRATGVTRQILMATIFLRDRWAPADSSEVPSGHEPSRPAEATNPPETNLAGSSSEVEVLAQSLLDISLDDLRKWAGKTIVREAVALVRSGLEVEVETHAGVTIRLIRHEIEARMLPGFRSRSASKILDEILTTAPRSQHKRWVVVALLAFQQSRGRTIESVEDAALIEPEGAPLTRQQLLISAQELLESVVATGLAHPSERMVERLFTLSISAGAVHLPRLARLLRTLADDVTLVLTRSAAADTGRLFDRLCLTHTLARVLAKAGLQPAADLVGYQRTQYDPVGNLELIGLGAYPWQSASGYEGLTVLFWDTADKFFRTWTTSRPTAHPGQFSMAQTYRHDIIWPGGAIQRLCRSRCTLQHARGNVLGRLSGSQSAIVTVHTPTDPSQLDFSGHLFTRWGLLLDYARSATPLGLREKNPLDWIVVLQPTVWGERFFDELQQQFCWRLQDDQESFLALTLPWAGVNETAIEFLETVKSDRDRLQRIVVRLVFSNQGYRFEPLSLLSAGTPQGHCILNPAFDRDLITSRQAGLLDQLRKKYGRDRVSTAMTADDETDPESDEAGGLDRLPPGLRAPLSETQAELLRIAETGLRRFNQTIQERSRSLAHSLERLGFAELSRALAELSLAGSGASQVIWCGHLCQLHRQVINTV